MSLTTFKPVAYRIPPVAGADGSLLKASKVTMMNTETPAPLQVKGREKPVLQESLSATSSRREMLHLTATSVGLLSLLLPAPAEAAARNASMRQKILQKFEELRQKFGMSKPKQEGEDTKPKDETDGKPKVHNNGKEAIPEPKGETKTKGKVENGVKETKPEAEDEKKHASTGEEIKIAPSEGPVIPALPGITNGKTVETTLP